MATKKISEGDVESYFVDQCEAAGFLCYKFISPGHNGVPDRVVIGNGKTVFVELKAPGKVPRKLQVHRMNEIRARGGFACVIDTLEGVDEFIKSLSTKKERTNAKTTKNAERTSHRKSASHVSQADAPPTNKK